MEDPEKGARTIAEIQKFAESKKKATDKYGCVRQPLFPSIPVDHIIPDVLHLFLRICDVLINLLITELRRLDGLEKVRIQKIDQSKVNIKKYENFLNETCKVGFHFFVDKDSKKLQWRDLTGPENLKVFTSINIPELFPNVPSCHVVQNLWKKFLDIYNTLRSHDPLKDERLDDFKENIDDWLKNFLSVYQTKNVTPYIHLLACHIPEFLKRYGTIAPFSQQGVEKLNDLITQDYFKSTNHRDALLQIMLKLNRLEELRDKGCVRVKQIHRCTKCQAVGHNARTCNKDA